MRRLYLGLPDDLREGDWFAIYRPAAATPLPTFLGPLADAPDVDEDGRWTVPVKINAEPGRYALTLVPGAQLLIARTGE